MLASRVAGVQHADTEVDHAPAIALLHEARTLRCVASMPYYHQVTDLRTGETRREPLKATTPEEAKAELAQLIHDCPECRAARERGEEATMITGADLLRELEQVRRNGAPWRGFKRARWRDLKKRVRRG